MGPLWWRPPPGTDGPSKVVSASCHQLLLCKFPKQGLVGADYFLAGITYAWRESHTAALATARQRCSPGGGARRGSLPRGNHLQMFPSLLSPAPEGTKSPQASLLMMRGHPTPKEATALWPREAAVPSFPWDKTRTTWKFQTLNSSLTTMSWSLPLSCIFYHSG